MLRRKEAPHQQNFLYSPNQGGRVLVWMSNELNNFPALRPSLNKTWVLGGLLFLAGYRREEPWGLSRTKAGCHTIPLLWYFKILFIIINTLRTKYLLIRKYEIFRYWIPLRRICFANLIWSQENIRVYTRMSSMWDLWQRRNLHNHHYHWCQGSYYDTSFGFVELLYFM